MSRVAYVNGRFVPHRHAAVSVEDRGFMFGDGVYEYLAVRNGRPIDEDAHLARLARSLREVRIAPPISDAALRVILRRTIAANDVGDGSLYLQVTRGAAIRDHGFPAGAKPALVITARRRVAHDAELAERGVVVATMPDLRWRRCDIKSVALLPNVLAKQAARERGGYEAWLVDDEGFVTEGASSNAWIVDAAGTVVTREDGPRILSGVTRLLVLRLCAEAGIPVALRKFDLAEARAAAEAFLTSTSNFVLPVVGIDGMPVGSGGRGPVTLRLQRAYAEHVRQSTARGEPGRIPPGRIPA